MTEHQWRAWTDTHDDDLHDPLRVAYRTREAARTGMLELPLPGGGATADRFAALRRFGEIDPVFARLAEGHVDAVAILTELGAKVPMDAFWGVWAAVPRSVTATEGAEGWRLDGERPWSSGAGRCTHALVTAAAGDGVRLFAVVLDPSCVTALPDTWPAVGMAASDSRTVRFTDAPAEPVGTVGAYTDRPGFAQGSIGVAACWHGGAVAIAHTLLDAARRRDLDPHALAHLGAVDATLTASRTLLDRAAADIDAEPKADHGRLARIVKATTETAVAATIERVGRALGAGPLCRDARHARRVADLSVYVRQSHAEVDLATLGTMTANGDPRW